jgi:hypothetical protein
VWYYKKEKSKMQRKKSYSLTFLYENKTWTMSYFLSIIFLFLCIFPLLIQCQSGTFIPLTGRIDSLDYVSYYRMITESGCVSICLQYSSPSCYGISYENFRQECRIVTESVPSSFIPNQALPNWRSYIRITDS